MRIGLVSPPRSSEDAFQSSSKRLLAESGNNLGNYAFIEALHRHLSPGLTRFGWGVSKAEAREKCDILVFAAANQLGSHNDLGGLATTLESVGLPLVVVGLGAQAPDQNSPVEMPEGTERWARVVAGLAPNKKPNIGVRGEFSRQVLEKLGLGDHAVITGCPSNFLNEQPDFYTSLRRSFARRRIDRLAVAAGTRHLPVTRDVERQFVQLVTRTFGLYVVQADLDLLCFARGEMSTVPTESFDAICQFILPHRSILDVLLWRQRHAMCFGDAASWMNALRNFDFVVGTRFHGVMLGVQAGLPGGVVTHDSRTLELCQTMGIPSRPVTEMPSHFELAELHNLFAFDADAYASKREQLRATYIDLLRGCGIEPHARLSATQTLAA